MPRKSTKKPDETPKMIDKKPDSKQIAMEPPKKALETKKRPRKAIETKQETKRVTIVQVGDAEFDISDIAEKLLKEYKSVHKRKHVEEFRVYVKPEEGVAYFTVNGEGAAEFKKDLR